MAGIYKKRIILIVRELCKQAVILAGGRGLRLRPLTDDRPKPMVEVNGRPFLEYLIDLLKENNIMDIVLLLGYMPEKIIRHFGDGSRYGVTIRYSVGDEEWETGKRLRQAADLLGGTFLLMYADNFWPMDINLMQDFYVRNKARYMVTVYNNRDGFAEYNRENNMLVAGDNSVLKYDRSRKDPQLNAVDIGFFVLQKSIIATMPERNFSFEIDTLPKVIAAGELVAFRTDHGYYSLTNPASLPKLERFFAPRKIIFIDRDGVINEPIKGDYVRSWSQFKFMADAVAGLGLLVQNGYEIFIISNQRGIGRGLMTEGDLEGIHSKMTAVLARHNINISNIYYCPHLEEERCFCRKPAPGLLHRAANENFINLRRSIFIGDQESDYEAGQAAGCKTILVGHKTCFLDAVHSII